MTKYSDEKFKVIKSKTLGRGELIWVVRTKSYNRYNCSFRLRKNAVAYKNALNADEYRDRVTALYFAECESDEDV